MNYIQPKDDNGLNPVFGMMPPLKAFVLVISKMINDQIITLKTDFAIIYFLEMEMNELGVDSYNSMISVVMRVPDLTESLTPTESSFKALNTGKNEFPLWKFDGMTPGKASHIKTVAKNYIRLMGMLGYRHPFYYVMDKPAK